MQLQWKTVTLLLKHNPNQEFKLTQIRYRVCLTRCLPNFGWLFIGEDTDNLNYIILTEEMNWQRRRHILCTFDIRCDVTCT